MAPPIRYARTNDGILVAHWFTGTGPPLIYLPPIPSHLELDWQLTPFRNLYDRLAVGRQLIRVDPSLVEALDEFLDPSARTDAPQSSGDLTPAPAPNPPVDRPTPVWDVFISHASEDKDLIARPLANLLGERQLLVWLDENELQIGDSLRERVDYGLANSRYGVVIFSESFFAKQWPTDELNGLLSLEEKDRKIILPVWHNVDRDYVKRFSPILADRLAAPTSAGLEAVAEMIVRRMAADETRYSS